MKERNRKLACLCITTALLASANMITVSAKEVKQPEKEQKGHMIHIGASASAMEALEQDDETFVRENEAENPKADEQEEELAVAQVDSYINVRSQPGMEGEVLGKLYDDSVGKIIGEENGWLQISSGTVEGYIKEEYAIRGEEGAAKAEEVGERRAKVEAVTLRLREEATTESETVGLLGQEEELIVEEETEGWVKVTTEEAADGFVSADHVEVYTVHPVAESREEEAARLQKEEEERCAAQAEMEQAETIAKQQPVREHVNAAGEAGSSRNPSGEAPHTASMPDVSKETGGLGSKIADYALQFVGNPYVYGGTSLTNGADCSGFVMSVYAHFGISLPRTSGEQGQCGVNVGGLSQAKRGDLVSYSGHIGIYIGNGQIVHASTEKTGIKISNASYRPILSVRRIV